LQSSSAKSLGLVVNSPHDAKLFCIIRIVAIVLPSVADVIKN
jgi:hypothetical protein